MTDEPIYVFLVSWERPIYLWMCLDALYRHTRHPHRFVLIDNASRDPLVHQVVESFGRRDLFHAVHRMPTNNPTNINTVFRQYRPELGRYVGYVESDAVVLRPPSGCWLRELVALCDANPSLGMLGSYCDVTDFVNLEVARRLHPGLSESELTALAKAESPERRLPVEPPAEPIISWFNPPGRLVLYRTEAIAEAGFRMDAVQHSALLAEGWQTGISTVVRHRHLSLLHVFDEPAYDAAARAAWFERMKGSDGERGGQSWAHRWRLIGARATRRARRAIRALTKPGS